MSNFERQKPSIFILSQHVVESLQPIIMNRRQNHDYSQNMANTNEPYPHPYNLVRVSSFLCSPPTPKKDPCFIIILVKWWHCSPARPRVPVVITIG